MISNLPEGFDDESGDVRAINYGAKLSNYKLEKERMKERREKRKRILISIYGNTPEEHDEYRYWYRKLDDFERSLEDERVRKLLENI